MNCNTCTLTGGLRLVHLPTESDVAYCGIAVAAGTRHEMAGQEGLAHLCEHLTFKGTDRRSALQIINSIEGVGGELNAFTNKEDTVFYAAVRRDHLRRAVDVLCDMVFLSRYPQAEVEKEREVVCEEIECYEDTPSELIYDEFENLLFDGHPLGHNILGTASQVRSYTSADAHGFARRHYRPDNCVFFVSGKADFGRLAQQIERIMQTLPPPPAAQPVARDVAAAAIAAPSSPRLVTRHRGTHQAHVMLGARAFSASDDRRMALFLLNNVLGGTGLNSRLNLALRERRGLVYTVDSSTVNYADTGLWAVYFGCDPSDVDRCIRLVHRELHRLASSPLSPRQMRAAQRQLRGQMTIASDNREQSALDFARHYLHTGRERSLERLLERIDSLTPDDLHAVARRVFDPSAMLTLVYV